MCSKCSVLIPVWKNDRIDLFEKAIDSVLLQTHKPGALTIVSDGEPSAEQRNLINKIKSKQPFPIYFFATHAPLGAWAARNFGLNKIETEYVALLDADDIMHPSRLDLQLDFLFNNPTVDVLGSDMVEIEIESEVILGYRNCPRNHQQILQKLKFNNPLFNSAVTFRRDLIISKGGYKNFPMVEDYELWIRMAQSGAQFSNLPMALVGFHTDDSLFRRRGGKQFLRSEVFIRKQLRHCNFKNNVISSELVFILRVVYRFIPWRLRKFVHHLTFSDVEINSGTNDGLETESDFMKLPPHKSI